MSGEGLRGGQIKVTGGGNATSQPRSPQAWKTLGQVSSPGPSAYAEELTHTEMVSLCLLPALCPVNLVP